MTDTHIFSARAECQRDAIELFRAPFWFRSVRLETMVHEGVPLPDVTLEFETNATLEQLYEQLDKIEDTHVLKQTLRQCPLKDNSLERNRSL